MEAEQSKAPIPDNEPDKFFLGRQGKYVPGESSPEYGFRTYRITYPDGRLVSLVERPIAPDVYGVENDSEEYAELMAEYRAGYNTCIVECEQPNLYVEFDPSIYDASRILGRIFEFLDSGEPGAELELDLAQEVRAMKLSALTSALRELRHPVSLAERGGGASSADSDHHLAEALIEAANAEADEMQGMFGDDPAELQRINAATFANLLKRVASEEAIDSKQYESLLRRGLRVIRGAFPAGYSARIEAELRNSDLA